MGIGYNIWKIIIPRWSGCFKYAGRDFYSRPKSKGFSFLLSFIR